MNRDESNNNEPKKPGIFDDDIETLDDEPEELDSPSETSVDTGDSGESYSSYQSNRNRRNFSDNQSSYDNGSSYNSNIPTHTTVPRTDFNPNLDKDGELNQGNRYKDIKQRRDDARQTAKDAKQNKSDAKDRLKDAKQGDNKEAKKSAKDDYKAAKKENRAAKSAKKDASRDLRQARMNRLNNVMHPGEALKSVARNKLNKINPINKIKNKANQGIDKAKDKAKEGVKKGAQKAGKAAKEGAKKAGQAAGKAAAKAGQTVVSGIAKLVAAIPPPVWVGILIILALLGVAMVIVVVVAGDYDDEELTNVSTTTCSYEGMNGIGEDTNVTIKNCDGTEEVTTIPLELYVAGVAANDVGGLLNSEATKAYLIVIRSKVLASAVTGTGNYVYNKDNDNITVNECEGTPKYWNYASDLYQSDTDPNLYTDKETDGYTLVKPALSDDEKALFEQTAESVSCMYITDSSNKVISVDMSFETLLNKASQFAGTDSGSFTGLLMSNGSVSNVNSGEIHYNSYFSGTIGDYAKWKQCDDRWGSISLGSKNVCSWGCLLVSMSMLVAHSGVDTGIANFDPGAFVNAMKAAGAVNSKNGNTSYGKVGDAVEKFVYVKSINPDNDYQKIAKLANDGCFIVLEVKTHCSGQHWVAVDNAGSAATNWSQIYIWDPGASKDPTLDHTYVTKGGKKTCHYNANKALCFKAKK